MAPVVAVAPAVAPAPVPAVPVAAVSPPVTFPATSPEVVNLRAKVVQQRGSQDQLLLLSCGGRLACHILARDQVRAVASIV